MTTYWASACVCLSVGVRCAVEELPHFVLTNEAHQTRGSLRGVLKMLTFCPFTREKTGLEKDPISLIHTTREGALLLSKDLLPHHFSPRLQDPLLWFPNFQASSKTEVLGLHFLEYLYISTHTYTHKISLGI